MPVRRHADPNNVQYIWDSIRAARHHHQSAELSNIIKFLQSETYCTPSQAELYITQALKDGLIVKFESKSVKLAHPSPHFRIPTDELTTPYDDGKDWYCIECHLAGDVTPCRFCHRVFHAECSRNVRHKQVVFQSVEKHNQLLNTSTINTSDINASDSLSENISNSKILSTTDKESSNVEESVNNNVKSTNIEAKQENSNSKINLNDFVYDETRCSICNLHRLEEKCELDKEELNHLLGFILNRIRSWLPSNLTHTMAPDPKYPWSNEGDLSWRAAQLFYQHMDMSVMELKLQSKEYTKLIEFMADVITIQHSVAIFHGIESQEYGAAELMIRDTCHDISELKTCVDCYRHSNEKINNKWFCLPCRNPHKLVWAKQKGYPYWPAKVIKETETTYDVRFFGGKYERSVLPKNKKNILSIDSKPKNHEIKKGSTFNKALEELKLHQHLLENPNSLKKYISRNVQKIDQKESKNSEAATKKGTSKKANKKSTKQNSSAHTHNLTSQLDQLLKDSNITKRKAVKRRNTISYEVIANKTRKNLMASENKQHSLAKSSVQEIIPISDAEEDEFLSLDYSITRNNDGCYGQVSSSTEYFISNDDGFHNQDISDNIMHPLEQPYSDAVEKMRRKLEQAKDKKQLITIAMDCMQEEIDRITNDHNEHLKKICESHQIQISETKKKQWCYNCEQDAIYHCCWNTAYCSPACQQQHWQAEHKKVCRRKR